jgi:hypothetical protein
METLRIERLTKLILRNGSVKLAQRSSKVLATFRLDKCLSTKRWAELQVDCALGRWATGASPPADGALAHGAGEAVCEDAAAALGGVLFQVKSVQDVVEVRGFLASCGCCCFGCGLCGGRGWRGCWGVCWGVGGGGVEAN